MNWKESADEYKQRMEKIDPYAHLRRAFHTVADGLMDWRDPPDPQASTLGAVRTLETAADSLMRLGDPGNAVKLYALALRLRERAGTWEEASDGD